MHVKAADIELYSLIISSHSSCVPELHGQHLCDKAEHLATATTQVGQLESTWAKYCPKNCTKHLSVPVISRPTERGGTEVQQAHSVEPQKMAISWCFSRTDGLSQGNEGSRGTWSWSKPHNSTFVQVQLCTATNIPTAQTDSWQLPLPEISPEVLLLYYKCLIWLMKRKTMPQLFLYFPIWGNLHCYWL